MLVRKVRLRLAQIYRSLGDEENFGNHIKLATQTEHSLGELIYFESVKPIGSIRSVFRIELLLVWRNVRIGERFTGSASVCAHSPSSVCERDFEKSRQEPTVSR